MSRSNRVARKKAVHRRRIALIVVTIVAAAAIAATAMWPGSHSQAKANAAPAADAVPAGQQIALPAEGTVPAAPTNQAKAACVIDRATGTVLYAKSADAHLAMGSTTKIMTALLVLEHVSNLDTYATVPAEAVGRRGAKIGLAVGERITIRNLLWGSIIKSATDCSVTLAHYVAGSENAFAVLMNKKAAALGLTNTHYVNASGITADGHYTSARDLAMLSRVAMQNARFRSFVKEWKVTIRWQPNHTLLIWSHNWLVRYYSWANGIKTGSTDVAGACMAASGTYHNRAIIITTLHEPSRDQERIDVLKLFKWADALYANRTIVTLGHTVTTRAVSGSNDQVALVAARTLTAMARRAATVTVKINAPDPLAGPVTNGQVAGTATYYADGQKLGTVNLLVKILPVSPSPSTSP
jgi:D-alanyl-D-alanine carboxypeptidase (penicillin-binding protein 5/6)